jgi:hypothetical protein
LVRGVTITTPYGADQLRAIRAHVQHSWATNDRHWNGYCRAVHALHPGALEASDGAWREVFGDPPTPPHPGRANPADIERMKYAKLRRLGPAPEPKAGELDAWFHAVKVERIIAGTDEPGGALSYDEHVAWARRTVCEDHDRALELRDSAQVITERAKAMEITDAGAQEAALHRVAELEGRLRRERDAVRAIDSLAAQDEGRGHE